MHNAARARRLALVALLSLAALGACSPPPAVDDGGMVCATASTLHCRDQGPGGSCDTSDVAAQCQDGIWACPTGAVEQASCVCFNGAQGDCAVDGGTTD